MSHNQKLEARTQELFKAKSISRTRLEDVQFDVAAARSRTDSAKARIAKVQALLSETRIRAPFSGVVTRKLCEIGQVTQPGEPLLVLEDQSRLKLKVQLKETDLHRLQIGQQVLVSIGSRGAEPIPGIVARIAPSADIQTHAFTVEVDLPATTGVYPGMFGKLHLLESE